MISQYINVLGHKFLSIFKITRKYNATEMNNLLGKEGQKKPLVSDDGSPNNACRCKGLQLCWVHEIRLYKKLFPYFNGYQALHTQILLQLRKFYHLAKQYGSDPPKTATPARAASLDKPRRCTVIPEIVTGELVLFVSVTRVNTKLIAFWGAKEFAGWFVEVIETVGV